MKLAYKEIGRGFPIILLHGFPFDHSLWDPVIPYLSVEYRYVFPDLRGFGASKVSDAQYFISDMTRDVIELMSELGIESAIIIGHSMGGYIALNVLRQISDHVQGIGLAASHIYADTNEKKVDRLETISRLQIEHPRDVFEGMPEKLSPDPTVRDYCDEAINNTPSVGLRGALHAMAHRQSSEAIWSQSIQQKLLLAGDEDQFITKKMLNQMAQVGRNVIYKELIKTGHMLMREKPKVFSKEIENFIKVVRRN